MEKKLAPCFMPRPNYRSVTPARSLLVRVALCAFGVQVALGGILVMIHCDLLGSGELTTASMQISCIEADVMAESLVVHHQERVTSPQARAVICPEMPTLGVTAGDVSNWMQDNESSMSMTLVSAERVERVEYVPMNYDDSDYGQMLKEDSAQKAVKSSKLPQSLQRTSRQSAQRTPAQSSVASHQASALPVVAQRARYKFAPLPPYPQMARREGREGVVMLQVRISSSGIPLQVMIAKSSGVRILDEVALAWVKEHWTFYPASNDQGSVESTMVAPLRFKLNS